MKFDWKILGVALSCAACIGLGALWHKSCNPPIPPASVIVAPDTVHLYSDRTVTKWKTKRIPVSMIEYVYTGEGDGTKPDTFAVVPSPVIYFDSCYVAAATVKIGDSTRRVEYQECVTTLTDCATGHVELLRTSDPITVYDAARPIVEESNSLWTWFIGAGGVILGMIAALLITGGGK